MITENLCRSFVFDRDRSARDSFGQALSCELTQKQIERFFAAIKGLTLMMGSERDDNQDFFAVSFLKRAAARCNLRFGSGGDCNASSTIWLSRAESWISGVNCAVVERRCADGAADAFGFLIVIVAIARTITQPLQSAQPTPQQLVLPSTRATMPRSQSQYISIR